MKPDSSFDLPHGARGFELEGLAIEFCGDKLLWIDRNRAEHYTMHMGSSSGVLDVHRTWTDADGLHHQTVFAIKLSELPKALEDLAETPLLQNLLQLYRPLRIGWLKRHGIMLVRGLDIVDNDAMAAITRKRKKRLQWMKIDSDLKLLSASPVTKFMTSLTVLFRSSRADETASRDF